MYGTKKSYGIACCRFTEKAPELLLVRKRYTYAFSAFVMGIYRPSDNMRLMYLFNGMTLDEKIDVLSMNFAQLWYRVWLHSKSMKDFLTAKNKFEMTFAVDAGRRLKSLISRSTNGSRLWEIPKGRLSATDRGPLQCAVREFAEETGMAKEDYKLIPFCDYTYSYVDEGMKYINTYFVAISRTKSKMNIANIYDTNQVTEIIDAKWMSLNKIRNTEGAERLTKLATSIMKKCKRSR
jgi:ADP-ribose pyrophosphatase YjhB (NUDIX family)